MPFTISHTAAVLPFSRLLARWHMLSAVVIGAMVPDFHVYIPWHLDRAVTHSLSALVTFCLPIGLATFWVFQLLIKMPMVEVLPDGAYARWKPFAAPANFDSVRRWLLAAVGVLLGSLTHLLWDAFTHEGARGVRMVPMLDEPIFDFGRHHIDAVRLLQDGSSLFGLIAVLLMVSYALRPGAQSPAQPRLLPARERNLWVAAYVVAAVGFTVAFVMWVRLRHPGSHSVFYLAIDCAVGVLRGLAAAVLAVSTALTLRLRTFR